MEVGVEAGIEVGIEVRKEECVHVKFDYNKSKGTRDAWPEKVKQCEGEPSKLPPGTHWVSSIDEIVYKKLIWVLGRSGVMALDAEWDRHGKVLLLQIGCQLDYGDSSQGHYWWIVFLVDLMKIHLLPPIYRLLKDASENPTILKLGFDFKHDLKNLSITFRSICDDYVFEKVVSYLDIATIDSNLPQKPSESKSKGNKKSLSAICENRLGSPLNKEFQCSVWSDRPLSDGQIDYAAEDVFCLLKLLCLFRREKGAVSTIVPIIKKYAKDLVLKELKTSKKKRKSKASTSSAATEKVQVDAEIVQVDEWEGPPPWDSTLGGDGSPKFLCDKTLKRLAHALRVVGFDAALLKSENTETSELIEQAVKEMRVLLTTNASLMEQEGLSRKQMYMVKSCEKSKQLAEVVKTFRLTIGEGQLLTRCMHCNGLAVLKRLSPHEVDKLKAGRSYLGVSSHMLDGNAESWDCSYCGKYKRKEIEKELKKLIGADEDLDGIIEKHAKKDLVLTEPKTSKKKQKSEASTSSAAAEKARVDELEGPPLCDFTLSGDGSPKFLCNNMLKGLAECLRYNGVDTALPKSEETPTRELIEQAIREDRVFLTKDTSLKEHEGLLTAQIYLVKKETEDNQLNEVIEAFHLKIHQWDILSRCTRCNKRLYIMDFNIDEHIDLALFSTEEFRIIMRSILPPKLLDEVLRISNCYSCGRAYWEVYSQLRRSISHGSGKHRY